MNKSQSRALIIFAKRPEPGAVKTRLTTLLSEEEASRLYEAFLMDALTQYQALGVDVRLYLSPPGPPLAFVPAQIPVFAQQGEGLGARMLHAFVESFAAGYEHLVIIGTDHPTLPSGYIEKAFEVLEQPFSIAVGPTQDGGFYLLGMNEYFPQLFRGMQYSHPDVFSQTIERAMLARAQLTILPPWYDVDTPAALNRLISEMRPVGEQAVHTRKIITALQDTYGDRMH